MIKITPLSTELVNSVFESTDIYHCSAFNPAGCADNSLDKVRQSFIYSVDGFISTINQYISLPARLFEYLTYHDQPLSLRHRINMVDTLISTNMQSNLPVHVSVKPNFKDRVIEIEDLALNPKNYKTVTHPGFTRMNTAFFLNSALKNVLIYINKKHSVKLKPNGFLTKINSVEDLLKYYTPFTDDKEFYLDFHVPKVEGNIKYHEATETFILKANGIVKSLNPLRSKSSYNSIHPSNEYAFDTFRSFNNFCKVFFSNELKVYLENGTKNDFKGVFQKARNKLKPLNQTAPVYNNRDHFSNTPIHPSKIKLESDELGLYSDIYKSFTGYFGNPSNKPSEHFYQNHLESDYYIKNSNEIGNLNFNSIVKKNNHKGIVLVLKKEAIDLIESRTFSEILLCFNPKTSITKNPQGSIVMLNCNNRFWIDNENYREAIIPNTFFKI